MRPSPPELVPLTCSGCGSGLEVVDSAAVFPCRRCGRAFIPQGGGLLQVPVQTAALTSELPRPAFVRYLAVWRFAAEVEVRSKSARAGSPPQHVWQRLQRLAGPQPACLFAPAFSLQRLAVQQLGVGLVERQPRLFLEMSLPGEQASQPAPEPSGGTDEFALEAEFGALSPILLSETDAHAVAHFIYLAVESKSTPELRGIDYELRLGPGELLFLPAVYDRRHVRDCNWRWLLAEFDSLVA
jgi:hypothetical protein